ncbi:MAG TPA: hypothetical protein VJR06_02805 [Nitrososphaerales archaeon]|nr:hypothetical protein [Nitrososphaerales archaeon]
MERQYDPRGRESYTAKMDSVDYGEMDAFKGFQDHRHYDCLSCPAMKQDPRSPTGYWCQLVGFPDQPWGCCSKWYPFEDVARAGT